MSAAPHRDPARWYLPDRIAWLARFRRAIASSTGPLATLVEREVHKPRWEALTSDILPLLACCRWHERHAARLLTPSAISGGGLMGLGVRAREHREALGVVAIIATWNYPLQILGIQLVQAIVAGNRVVVKPSEHAAGSQAALLQLAQEAGLPEGVLSTTEATREAGARLLRDQSFAHVLFTGSTGVGRAIASVAADRLTPTTLELSGRDSAIVLPDANPRLAARSIWNAVQMNAGQTCMAPRRALVVGDAYGPFVSALAPLAAGAKPRRLITRDAAQRVWNDVREAVSLGGRSLSGVVEPPDGAVIRPLAIVDCPREALLVRGEHFGPAIAVIRCSTVQDALALHLANGPHLATSVFARRPASWGDLAGALGSSIVTFNDAVVPAGHPGVSLGGHGDSGWGASRGREGLLALTRVICQTRTSTWLRTPVEEPTSQRVGTIERWIAALFGGRAAPTAPAPGGVGADQAPSGVPACEPPIPTRHAESA